MSFKWWQWEITSGKVQDGEFSTSMIWFWVRDDLMFPILMCVWIESKNINEILLKDIWDFPTILSMEYDSIYFVTCKSDCILIFFFAGFWYLIIIIDMFEVMLVTFPSKLTYIHTVVYNMLYCFICYVIFFSFPIVVISYT